MTNRALLFLLATALPAAAEVWTYDLPGGDTIVFTLERPEKVAVMANHD